MDHRWLATRKPEVGQVIEPNVPGETIWIERVPVDLNPNDNHDPVLDGDETLKCFLLRARVFLRADAWFASIYPADRTNCIVDRLAKSGEGIKITSTKGDTFLGEIVSL